MSTACGGSRHRLNTICSVAFCVYGTSYRVAQFMGISKLFAWIMHVRHVNLNIVCVSGLLLKHTGVLQWFQRANRQIGEVCGKPCFSVCGIL